MVHTVSILRIRTLVILVISWLGFGLMLSSSFAQQIGLFYHSDYIQIDEGNIFAEGSNMNASLQMLGYEMNLINEFTSTNIIESDLIIIPELERKNLFLDLDESQKQDLRNYVSNGGGIIISGVVAPNEANANNATDLLNGVFDFSIETSEVALTGHSIKEDQGNQYGFNSSPDKVPNNNSVAFITSGLPSSSVSIYSDISNNSYSSVSILNYGEGSIIYLGWGWWNAIPNGTQDGGWMSILEASINLTSCPKPELTTTGQTASFSLKESKEVDIDIISLPLHISTCTEDYHLDLSKSLFTCDDLGTNEITVTLIDKIGRTISEKVLIEIIDDKDFCRSAPSFINLQGSVTTSIGKPIDKVKINLKGENSFNTNSDIFGNFQIADIPLSGDYNLKAIKDTKYLNGVSTYDMVLLSQHINGLRTFTNPYQFIAADVNNSGTLSIKDIIELRDLILFQITEFENLDSWQIINNSTNLTDPLSPEVDKNNIFEAGSMSQSMSFTGVKIGDINATANSARSTAKTFSVSVEDVFLQKGENIRIPILLEPKGSIQGFQMGFTFDSEAILLTEVSSDLEDFGSANINNNAHGLFMSWVKMDRSVNEENIQLYLDFEIQKAGYLSEYFSLINSEFSSELYDENLNIIELDLEFIQTKKLLQELESTKNAIYNFPNPFVEFTDITFVVTQDIEVKLEVYAPDGKLILTKSNTFQKGKQKIRVDSEEISNPGLYYYSITQGDIQKTTNTFIKL